MLTPWTLSFEFQIPTTLFPHILIHCVMSITQCCSCLHTDVIDVQVPASIHLLMPSGILPQLVQVIWVTFKDPASIDNVSWRLPTWLMIFIYPTGVSQRNSVVTDPLSWNFTIIEEWVLLPNRSLGPGETLETHTVTRLSPIILLRACLSFLKAMCYPISVPSFAVKMLHMP